MYGQFQEADDPIFAQRLRVRASKCAFGSKQSTIDLLTPFPNSCRLDHHKCRSDAGILTTSLVEDVCTLLQTESTILHNLLTEHKLSGLQRTHYLHQGIRHLLVELQNTQMNHKLMFLTNLQDTCSFANDCFRMSERLELFMQPFQKGAAIQAEGQATMDLFAQDAVAAAERTQLFIMREIQQTTIPSDFFSKSWEVDWTSNEIAERTIQIFETHLLRIQRFLMNDFLYHKAIIMAARAVTCFYIRCLVTKADSVSRRRRNRERFHLPGEKQPFKSYSRALRRLSDDIRLMMDYFRQKVNGTTIYRIIANDMYILELIRECLSSTDTDSLESFIVVIHKRTGADLLVTRFFVGDVWMLMNQTKPKRSVIRETMDTLQPDLQMVTSGLKEIGVKTDCEVTFVRLDDMLKVMYEDRVAQGILPACWACLPKIEGLEGDETVVIQPIRKMTRKVVELKWNRTTSFKSV